MKIPFEQWPQDQMREAKPCRKNNHHNNDGINYRILYDCKSGACLACLKKLPPGLFDYVFPNAIKKIVRKKLPGDPESVKKRRSAASMRWNKKNPDKVKQYTEKYQSRPDIKKSHAEKSAQRMRDWVAKSTPEEREARRLRENEKRKVKYWSNKEYREKIQKDTRSDYQKLMQSGDTEKIARFKQMQHDYYVRRKDEHRRQKAEGQKSSIGSEAVDTQDVSGIQ
jgi:hypothetical protein